MVRYIALEGIDGGGKSTLCRALADELVVRERDSDEPRTVHLLQRPGSHSLGGKVRAIIKDAALMAESAAESAQLLMAADEATYQSMVLERLLYPQFGAYPWVVQDRHHPVSAWAYSQAVGRSTPSRAYGLARLVDAAPVDLLIWVECDPGRAARRVRESKGENPLVLDPAERGGEAVLRRLHGLYASAFGSMRRDVVEAFPHQTPMPWVARFAARVDTSDLSVDESLRKVLRFVDNAKEMECS